ncbi:MAG TPA: hypothetical protein IAC96_12125 [Candidatus Fimimorpha faecalis]|uniref:Uncharacterized protein n=1 Tax=Candidatus Fimimorpha faecalis TaxID=2840824 RepID=A0A9D1JE41_9FIRM|nr:hypothetical protein [Candidatus Fimimorpha faecalis]
MAGDLYKKNKDAEKIKVGMVALGVLAAIGKISEQHKEQKEAQLRAELSQLESKIFFRDEERIREIKKELKIE